MRAMKLGIATTLLLGSPHARLRPVLRPPSDAQAVPRSGAPATSAAPPTTEAAGMARGAAGQTAEVHRSLGHCSPRRSISSTRSSTST